MKYRKLRIAWSVGWGLLTVLLCVLWVRSYWWWDVADLGTPGVVHSLRGCIRYRLNDERNPQVVMSSVNLSDLEKAGVPLRLPSWYGFEFRRGPKYFQFALPNWLLILAATGLSAAPWIRWQFSLRTLLIAMTLLAVGLGLAVYANRN